MTSNKNPLIVTLTGHLGSGKSSLAKKICDHINADYYSTGVAQRRLAAELGISTLEMNKRAETDHSIDDKIDSIFAELSKTDVPLVVDSRMAFHFIPESFKIRLKVNPYIAAERIMKDDDRASETYSDIEEAVMMIEKRRESERERFLSYYKVDIEDDNAYDLIIDTSGKTPHQVFKIVTDAIDAVLKSS